MLVTVFGYSVLSSLLAKLGVLGGALAVFLVLHKTDAELRALRLAVIVIIAIVKDTVLAVFIIPELLIIAEIVYICAAACVLVSFFSGTKPLIISMITVNAAMAFAYIGFFDLAPLVLTGIGGFILCADIALFALTVFIRRSETDDTGRRFIIETWMPIAVVLLAYAIMLLTFGYGTDFVTRVVTPLSYGWFIYMGLMGFRIHDTETLSVVSYYEESIDALYNLFFRIGMVLKENFSADDVLSSLNEAVIEETGADGGSIYLVDEFDDVISAKAYAGVFPPPFALPESLPKSQRRIESYMKHAQLPLGETILGEVAKTGSTVFVPDVSHDKRFVSNGEEDFLRISSFIALPLMLEDKIIGVSAVAKTKPNEQFDEAAFDRYKLLTNFGTLAVSNFFSFLEAKERSGIEQSAGIAAEIQTAVLPKKLPQFPTLSIGAFTVAAKGVSSDYYDILRTREDKIVSVIGDIAGKGVQAALIMVMIRAILHLITNTNKDIATVLDWVNKGIAGKIDLDHYATLGLVAFNLKSGELEYANAAHQPLLIYRRATDMVETIDIKSVPIGIEKNTEYKRKALRLYKGDIAVLYTDGIIEAMNEQGKQFGRKALGQFVTQYRDLSPKEIAGKIKSELVSFIGAARQHDDQTMLIFKMNS